MKYAKPEVSLIDNASAAIQTQNPKAGINTDHAGGFNTPTAYEADE